MFIPAGRSESKDHRFPCVHPVHVRPLSLRKVATRYHDFVIWLEQRGIEPVRDGVFIADDDLGWISGDNVAA